MPRTKLGETYSPSSSKPKVGNPVNEGGVGESYTKVQETRKIPGSPYYVDIDTGLIYLDKAILDMIK